MPRTQRTHCPNEPRGEIVDTLLLKFEDRCRQQGFAFGGKGICVEFDFPTPPRLRTDDLLVLDDGNLVEVVADVEPVLEVRAKDFAAAARLILALGNRHVPAQIFANRVRVLRTAETEALMAEHGIVPIPVTAPFEPDDDAPGHGHHHAHTHEHGHGHSHDHVHGDRHHGDRHGQAQGHEHDHRLGHEHGHDQHHDPPHQHDDLHHHGDAPGHGRHRQAHDHSHGHGRGDGPAS